MEAVKSARPISLPLYGPFVLFLPPVGRPTICLTFNLLDLLFTFANTLSGYHADGGPLVLGGAISGNDRLRCSRRPPPVACGVARVLCLGREGHQDIPKES